MALEAREPLVLDGAGTHYLNGTYHYVGEVGCDAILS